MEPIELSLFASRLQAICEEMGTALRRTAFSPNIRDRLDFSCAVFDTKGRLSAQAAHIPVHLGSMAFAMSGIVEGLRPAPGDMVILNDPYLGGTHLPDVTLIAPLFHETEHCGFVVNRAHHADIGCATPGGMPIATRLEDEGLVIAPQRLMAEGRLLTEVLDWLIQTTRDPATARGDLAAQIGANRCGLERLGALVAGLGPERYRASLADLNDYGEGMARTALARIPAGCYRFTDWLDDDGQGQEDIPIRLALTVSGERAHADFAGTAAEVPGNLNCPLSVAAAAVYYAFYCLMPRETPACAGAFRPITLSAPEGCLLNARRPAAVAAGNVETSTRIVDVVLGALAQALPEA
ncbi:MAG: hydantoinase B/oxoprolinase family protein, partial [Gammaproteobacteria bacterium]